MNACLPDHSPSSFTLTTKLRDSGLAMQRDLHTRNNVAKQKIVLIDSLNSRFFSTDWVGHTLRDRQRANLLDIWSTRQLFIDRRLDSTGVIGVLNSIIPSF